MPHRDLSGPCTHPVALPFPGSAARRCLATFCHPIPSRLALGIYHFEDREVEWIDIPELADKLEGAYGIHAVNGHYYVLLQLQANASCLAVLNQDLVPVNVNYLQKTRDAHSLIWHEGHFYAASTATNRIMRLTLDSAQNVLAEEEYWVYDEAAQDTVHLNSLALLDGRLYVTLFGKGTGTGWLQRDQGEIIDVDANVPIARGLFHPHSLRALDGKLYVAESRRGRVLAFTPADGTWTQTALCELPGYARGLTTDGQHLYIGISSARRKSKSTGRLHRPPGESRDHMHCRIHRLNPRTGSLLTMDLTPWAREIYDIEILPHIGARVPWVSGTYSLMRRIQEYDRQHFDLLYQHDRASNDLLAYGRGLRHLIDVQQDYQAALKLLTYLLSQNAEQPEWHYLAGFCLHQQRRDLASALDHYTAALTHGFDEFWVSYNRGQLYIEMADYAQAESNLRRALALRPDFQPVIALLQQFFSGAGSAAGATSYAGSDTDVYKNNVFRIEQSGATAQCVRTSIPA